MSGIGGQVDGGRELSLVEQGNPFLGSLLRKLVNGINTLSTNTASSATGENAPPPPIASVSVKVQGEYMHVAINHPGQVQRNVQYFTEVTPSTSPNQPIVYHHGTSRTPPPFVLPTFPDAGMTKTSYTVHAYAQNPGSQPTGRVIAQGGPFQMSGTTQMTLLQSTGSGTGSNSGNQAGSGLGKTQVRQP